MPNTNGVHSSGCQSPLGGVIMVRPASFGYDPRTAESNAFQNAPKDGASEKEIRYVTHMVINVNAILIYHNKLMY